MFLFKYYIEAVTKNGTKVRIYKYASNVKELKKALKEAGFSNIRIKRDVKSISDIKFGAEKLSYEDLSYLFNEIYYFINLGNNVSEAFRFIKENTDNKRLKDFLNEVVVELEAGSEVHEALESAGQVPDFAILIITTAKETGNYEEAFKNLAEYYENLADIKGKLKSSLIQPAFLMVALLGASLFLITKVIPKIYAMFEGNNKIKPPKITEALYNINIFVTEYTNLTILSLLIFIMFMVYILKNERFSVFLFKLPIIGKVKKMEFQTEFLMTYYLLAKYGATPKKIISIIHKIVSNPYVKRTMTKMKKEVEFGMNISEVIKKSTEIFDPVVAYMFKRGETGGAVDEVAGKLYHMYKERTKKYLEHFPFYINTATLLIGGSILVIIFLGIIQPIVVFIQNASNM